VSRALIVGAVLSAGLLSGGMLMQSGAWSEASASSATPRLYEQVLARIRNDYIDSISVDEMHRRAAFGLVKELDDAYSALLEPERITRLRESTTGQYAGIGVEIDMRDGYVTVIAPLAGTPADSAGIVPGDRIVSVDGRATHGLTMEEVEQAMRGAAGSTVRLGVERGAGTAGDVEDLTFTLRRRTIRYHPVQRSELLPGAVGYVRLATFSEQAARELRVAIDALRSRGAKSLILDLRENPGGLLEQGIEVAELFLDPGQTVASTKGRMRDANDVFTDRTRQYWPDLPVVALIDSGTASAAEIVAGALQDNERAVIVGSPSYGKGSAQSLFPLTREHLLKLTTARWFTPKGRTIERDSTRGGISPDIAVRDTVSIMRESVGRQLLSADAVVVRAHQLLQGVVSPTALRARMRD
jgi:carboxyl-terminal processing protease